MANYFLAFLPILFIIIVFVVLSQNLEWREALLLSAIIWGAVVVSVTEGLSIFNQLTRFGLAISWLALDITAGAILFSKIVKPGAKPIRLSPLNLRRFDSFIVGCILIIILTTGLIAFLSPPNSHDSMNYHMSRIMHWIQDRNVKPYPTNIGKGIYMTPGGEYEILQLQLLSGGDRLANLIGWLSFIGSIIGVSLIARELGADHNGQLFSAVFCATIPMAILQASSTENHLTTAFYLVCFAYYSLHAFNSQSPVDIICMGFSLGLSIFSKSTAYIFAAPFVVFIGIWVLLSKERNRIWLWLATALIVLAINSGQYIRNYSIYGDVLGPTGNDGVINDIFTPASITSNVIRNLALHISTPSTRVNGYFEGIIHKIHNHIGLSEYDLRTSWAASLGFSVPPISFDEDKAGNPIHLLFIIGTIGYCFIFLSRTPRLILYYILALVSGFLLFCVFLKWQDWHSRLHLPLFILASSILGVTITKIRPKYISYGVICFFLIVATPWLITGKPRSLIGKANIFNVSRNEQYFAVKKDLYKPYQLAVQQIEQMHVSKIGLLVGSTYYEYPLWALLNQSYNPLPRIEHVGVENETRIVTENNIYYRSFNPDVVLTTDPNVLKQDIWQLDDGRTYRRVWQFGSIGLFIAVK